MEKSVKLLLSIGLTLLLIVGVSIASDLEQDPGGGEDPTAIPEERITKSIMSGAQSNPGFILVITFDAGYLPNSKNIVNALGSLGYTVTDLYNPAAGVIASTLASQTFQQVWLFLMLHCSCLNCSKRDKTKSMEPCGTDDISAAKYR